MNLIEFKQVAKRFGDCVANHDLSFAVEKGTIHGLIGENGAGKSTAMKVLFGFYPPDAGEIFIRGKKSKIQHPDQAMRLGIGMVHQHFMLAEPETVLDNIILGHEPGWIPGVILRKKAREQLNSISKEYGLAFDKWDVPVSHLSVGEQQRVEIIKLLYQKSEVLILDEPTAVLTPQEVKELFHNLLRLKKEGKTIILISHKLKEVLEFTDTVTVMRRGTVVGTRATKDTHEDELAELMVGRKVSFTYEGVRRILSDSVVAAPVLQVSGLHVKGTGESCQDVSLGLRPGEILGIGGVQGNGQSILLRFLSNPASYWGKATGEYNIKGSSALADTPLNLRRRGVSMVPEDRLAEGLLLDEDMTENFLLGQHEDPRYQQNFLGLLNRRAARQQVEKNIRDFDIRPPEPSTWAGRMSGGNQQKLVIARALDSTPQILLIAHPTRGVDVGAIELIHEAIMNQRNAGKAIILFSSELDELMDLSDRLLVFYGGRVQAEFGRREFDPWKIGKTMGGGAKE
jgi:simple sugar transport system ATP-binding protein